MPSHRTVVVTQLRLTHYRTALFDALRNELMARGVQMVLLHGQADPSESGKADNGELDWAVRVKNRYFKAGKKYLAWQPYPRHLEKADLVILTQENRILSNYFHLLQRRFFSGSKVAFWGHGANFQSHDPGSLKEKFKRWTTGKVDWWFAYTRISANLVEAAGFPARRITVLNNAVDTNEMESLRESITAAELGSLRKSLGFHTGPVAVYIGSLYADKRLGFLFAAAEKIRHEIPGFHLLIIGDGPERDKVKEWCAGHPWAHSTGALFGRQKVLHLATAEVMLNPGLVGLGILDSFVCKVPMVTTHCGLHSPEIAYLDNGINGIMTADTLDDFVRASVTLLRDNKKLEALRAGCHASAREYTMENMARRFADGIVQALDADSRREGI